MKCVLLLLLTVVSALGANVNNNTTIKDRLIGHYKLMKGGFNENLSLEIKDNNSYILKHIFWGCVVDESGEVKRTHSEERGSWRVENDLLILIPKSKTKNFPDAPHLTPALSRKLAFIPGIKNTLLMNADDPDLLTLIKEY